MQPPSQTPAEIAATLARLSPAYAPTPLLDLKPLASRLGVAQVLAKHEGARFLNSFKSLGGTYAGLAALARAHGTDIARLLSDHPRDLPALICASDGNHGLAVAAAARFAGTRATVFLHARVSQLRARRIEAQGADIAWVEGTYDDAVDAAAAAAKSGGSILVADTARDASDPIVRDAMAGYGVIAHEVRQQVAAAGGLPPTHLFVQAGVGGLAAALAEGLRGWLASPARIVAVEPERCACLQAALAAGRVVRLGGDLATAAEMLSCGEASAPAFEILRAAGAEVVTVSEQQLHDAPNALRAVGGPATTPSGATGLAGLMSVVAEMDEPHFGLTFESRVLIVISEAALDEAET